MLHDKRLLDVHISGSLLIVQHSTFYVGIFAKILTSLVGLDLIIRLNECEVLSS